jgi:hypothetical protein
VTSLVRPLARGTSFQAQVLLGFSQSNHSPGWRALILKAVVSFTLLAMGTPSPTCGSWNSARIRVALGRPALSKTS